MHCLYLNHIQKCTNKYSKLLNLTTPNTFDLFLLSLIKLFILSYLILTSVDFIFYFLQISTYFYANFWGNDSKFLRKIILIIKLLLKKFE